MQARVYCAKLRALQIGNQLTSYTERMKISDSGPPKTAARVPLHLALTAALDTVAAHRAWNRLPTELKLTRSTPVFKRSLKKVMFQAAYCT